MRAQPSYTAAQKPLSLNDVRRMRGYQLREASLCCGKPLRREAEGYPIVALIMKYNPAEESAALGNKLLCSCRVTAHATVELTADWVLAPSIYTPGHLVANLLACVGGPT